MKTKATRTPGPWEIDGDLINGPQGSGNSYRNDGEEPRHTVCQQADLDCDRWGADAPLLAAAPDLLAACKAIAADIPDLWGDDVIDGRWLGIDENAVQQIIDAIAKAEGGES